MNAVIEKPKLLSVMATRLGVEPENMLRILKNTCIKPTRGGKEATNEEVQAFLIVANRYDLNPLTREIFAFESNGSIIPIVSIDGWATLVNRNENFDGCDFETAHGADGNLLSITCRIYDKRRGRPVAVTEYLAECQRPSQPWRTMPHRMLRHKAFMQAARLAFGLSGIYDEDEGLQIAKNEMQSISEPAFQKTAAAGTAGLRNRLLPTPSLAEAVAERQNAEEEVANVVDAVAETEAAQPSQSNLWDGEPDFDSLFETTKSARAAGELANQLASAHPDSGDAIEQAYEARLKSFRRAK